MRRGWGVVIWLVGTLLAIAVIGENLYLGAGLAIGFGIVFGVFNLVVFLKGG
ncbi:MAG: hypothetical protein IT331_07610 [Anaerolineae bacterium]|nr:hypothetical protein [Anaerolineae bacterium]